MKEKHEFGSRQKLNVTLPNDESLKEAFGVTNNGCAGRQIVDFIAKTTGKQIEMKNSVSQKYYDTVKGNHLVTVGTLDDGLDD